MFFDVLLLVQNEPALESLGEAGHGAWHRSATNAPKSDERPQHVACPAWGWYTESLSTVYNTLSRLQERRACTRQMVNWGKCGTRVALEVKPWVLSGREIGQIHKDSGLKKSIHFTPQQNGHSWPSANLGWAEATAVHSGQFGRFAIWCFVVYDAWLAFI